MVVRPDPLKPETNFVSNLQKSPETSQGEKSGIASISGETYTDYWGKYTSKLKTFFPHATDDQIEALLYFKKHGMKKEYYKLYSKLWSSKPENRKRQIEKWRKKYQSNPEFRQQRSEYKKLYRSDPEIKKQTAEKKRMRYASDPEFRKKINDYEKSYKPKYRQRKKLKSFNQFVQDNPNP